MRTLWRWTKALPAAIATPFLLVIAALSIALCDLWWLLFGRRRTSQADTRPDVSAASVVIPNWNGKDLLEKYLLSVIMALAGNDANEIIVVDNGSTDGSAEFLRTQFPQVKLLALPQNLGFGGGSNAGFKAAKNDIVVLLNSDMRVDADFLAPLLAGFTDKSVFAVSCQIFFSDPAKKREETGLTQATWEYGHLRVRHVIDQDIQELYPCYYGGGGSCAFDRRKFLALGGFDHVFRPFYLEDTDLGHMAWKRGWKVLYHPASKVWHEHRGTIGKHFDDGYIQSIVKKNFILYVWKNIHSWQMLGSHFANTGVDVVVSLLFGPSPERASFRGLLRAIAQIPDAWRARLRARSLASIDDQEALRRHGASYYRDRFMQLPPAPERLSVLFVSPYPVYPPTHGGGVFMYQTICELAKLCDLHLIILLDWEHELEAHQTLRGMVKSIEFLIRWEPTRKVLGSPLPHAVREFQIPDLRYLIDKQILLKRIDVLQLEYTVMGQYCGKYRQIPSILFEHDVYFQSIARGLPYVKNPFKKTQHIWEYLRAIRYELKMLPKADRVQVCSRENREFLESYLPTLRGRIDDGFRAGIDTAQYEFRPDAREPCTVLFLGSFRHIPNQEALEWFLANVWDRILAVRPETQLVLIGSDPPPRHSLPSTMRNVELIGFVPDVKDCLARYQVFICPILSGSGVRVKLLEAFAAGIPTVSTRLGAEGLATEDGAICGLADDPQAFADWVIRLLKNPEEAAALASRARAYVEQNRDMRKMTTELVDCYRREVFDRRAPK
ncbi:MAG TPA: glycosyltransferase [Bryobacteraceae bacterium]|jgi:GT2 family glycosyltransferase/glycosyltransferase involved in cell wall biosynthesis